MPRKRWRGWKTAARLPRAESCKMMEKMGRGCGRVNMAMVTEQYETIELEQELSKYIHQEKHENAKEVLESKAYMDLNSQYESAVCSGRTGEY